MSVSLRENRGVVRVSGPDAQKLLNDVLTAEISAEPGNAHWWALLSPQGKIQAEGLVSWQEDAFWMDVPTTVMDAFLKRMRLYKLRADATIEDLRESHAVGWSDMTGDEMLVDKDPRHEAMGYRVITPKGAAQSWLSDDSAYAAARIQLGIAELGSDFETDSHFPHDIGMDLLAGIDFSKGCYVGQEVVSRMKHRGTARRRPVLVSGIGDTAATTVACAGKDVGIIGRVVDGAAIGLLRIDRLKAPQEATLDGAAVVLALPDWASYDFAESLADRANDVS